MAIDPVEDLQFAITRYREAVPTPERRPFEPPWDPVQADVEVSAVADAIAPRILPAELAWFWRTCDPFLFPVLPYPQLTTPEFALECWVMEQEEGDEHPRVLFPFAYESQGFLYVELGLDPAHPSPVWSFAYRDEEFVCRYPSIASLFHTTADAVDASDIPPPAVDTDLRQTYFEVISDEHLDRFVDRYFADSPVAERRSVPYGDQRLWPPRWYDAQGIADDRVDIRGRTHTVEEFKAAAQTEVVTGRLHGTWRIRAGGVRDIGILTDETGGITLAIAKGVRPLGPPNGEMELDVEAQVPFHGRPDPLTELDPTTHFIGRDHLASIDAMHDPTLPVTTRMVPLS